MNYSKMIPTKNGFYHNGFYECGGEQMLYEIENPEYDFYGDEIEQETLGLAYENAHIFKNGSCDLFAMVLKERTSVKVYEIIGCNERLIHAFGVSKYMNQVAYIDVRGITTYWKEFWTGFTLLQGEEPKYRELVFDLNNISEDEHCGLKFAYWIFDNYRDYYVLS